MKGRRTITMLVLFVVIAWVTQYLFIAFIPQIIFRIACHRSGKPFNTIIHTTKTDASLRRVVLPNPDFIYSACFFDVTDKNLEISGQFPDSTVYCSLGFYGNNVQPFYVLNNSERAGQEFKVMLSSSDSSAIIPPTMRGAILMRIIAYDSSSRAQALQIQQKLSIKTLSAVH